MASQEEQATIRRIADEAIKQKITEYRKIAIAFLCGLGLLVIFLVVNGLVSKKALIVRLHDTVFGIHFEKEIKNFLLSEVAVSYNTQFWLRTRVREERSHHIFFYATDKQEVKALVTLKHHGAGEPREVKIKIDRLPEPIYQSTEDMDFALISLTPHLEEARKHVYPTSSENVHFLIFSLKEGSDKEDKDKSDDEVLVQALINVQGGGH